MILTVIEWMNHNQGVADWFGAVGTIGAVWIAVSYRRTKVKFDVEAVFDVVAFPMPGEPPANLSVPQLVLDIFNINDPDLMIKDIDIVYKNTRISILKNDPIIVKGFEAKRINFFESRQLRITMNEYSTLLENHAMLEIVLFGDKKYIYNIKYIE